MHVRGLFVVRKPNCKSSSFLHRTFSPGRESGAASWYRAWLSRQASARSGQNGHSSISSRHADRSQSCLQPVRRSIMAACARYAAVALRAITGIAASSATWTAPIGQRWRGSSPHQPFPRRTRNSFARLAGALSSAASAISFARRHAAASLFHGAGGFLAIRTLRHRRSEEDLRAPGFLVYTISTSMPPAGGIPRSVPLCREFSWASSSIRLTAASRRFHAGLAFPDLAP